MMNSSTLDAVTTAGRTEKPITRQTSLCYVCKQPVQFARDSHSREEIEESKKTGRTISASIRNALSDEVAAIVMEPEPEDDSDTTEDSVDVNLTHVPVQVLHESTTSFDTAAFNAQPGNRILRKRTLRQFLASSRLGSDTGTRRWTLWCLRLLSENVWKTQNSVALRSKHVVLEL
jgi:hypothetical protein